MREPRAHRASNFTIHVDPSVKRRRMLEAWLPYLILGAVLMGVFFYRSGPSGLAGAAAKPFPANGTEFWVETVRNRGETVGLLHLRDGTRNGLPKLFRLRRGGEGGERFVDVFVEAGQTAKVYLPVGKYGVSMGQGPSWYGREDLFGPTGTYWRMGSIKVRLAHERGSHRFEARPFTMTPGPNGQQASRLTF